MNTVYLLLSYLCLLKTIELIIKLEWHKKPKRPMFTFKDSKLLYWRYDGNGGTGTTIFDFKSKAYRKRQEEESLKNRTMAYFDLQTDEEYNEWIKQQIEFKRSLFD